MDHVTDAIGTLPITAFKFEASATRRPAPAELALPGVALAGLAAGQRLRHLTLPC